MHIQDWQLDIFTPTQVEFHQVGKNVVLYTTLIKEINKLNIIVGLSTVNPLAPAHTLRVVLHEKFCELRVSMAAKV